MGTVESLAIDEAPFPWIVNSNALGVAFLARERGFRITFLSRHAVARLADGTLLGHTAEELLDQPATVLANAPELQTHHLSDPNNYPATALVPIGERWIELAISPVMSSVDDYLGAMVTFKDSTETVLRQQSSIDFKQRISDYALNARDEADRTEQVVQSLSEAVATVNGNGANIANLVLELSTLNNKTRMLSLNASIESVRAGEAGRAFRVIADEVGELALRTQQVTNEVERILKTIEVDSNLANESAIELAENVASLIGTQRAMDEEIQGND